MWEQLQQAEYRLFCRAVQEATQLAAAGEAAAAQQCLLAGLERASDLVDAGEGWAVSLVRDYRRALAQLASCYPAPEEHNSYRSARVPCLNPRFDPRFRSGVSRRNGRRPAL